MASISFYIQGRRELEKAITFDEKKNYQHAVTHYIRSIEYHIAGYKRDKNVNHRNQIYVKIQSYLERAEMVKTLKLSIEEATKNSNNNNTNKKTSNTKNDDYINSRRLSNNNNNNTSSNEEKIMFKDIKGLEYSKMALYESVILPQKQPQVFQGARKPFKGILLYGPPGTGKSMLAQALSNEANCHFLNISASDIFSKGMGDSEKNLRNIFQLAREKSPCILFVDEVDSIGRSRQGGSNSDTESTRRVKTELLKQLDGFESNDGVMFLAATNTPWELDSALRRRLEKRIFTPLPTLRARADILKSSMGDEKCNLKENDYIKIAQKLECYSSADCALVVREALMEPIRQLLRSEYFRKVQNNNKNRRSNFGYIACNANDAGAIKMNIWTINPDELITPTVTLNDFNNAVERTKPSINLNDLKQHHDFAKEFGGMPDKSLEKKLQEREDVELARIMAQNNNNNNNGIFRNVVQSISGFFGGWLSSSNNHRESANNNNNTEKNNTKSNNGSNHRGSSRRPSEKKKRRVAAPAM